MHCSRKNPWLYEGVTTLIRGHPCGFVEATGHFLSGGGGNAQRLSGCLIPGDRLIKTYRQGGTRLEVEQFPGPSHVQAAPWLPIGLVRVEEQFALKAGLVRDEAGESRDGNFLARPHVHRTEYIVGLRGQLDGSRCVLDVKELPCWFAGPPDHQRRVATFPCLD